MTPTQTAKARAALEAASGATPACIPLERLGGKLTAAERAHAGSCARCQTELTVFAEVNDPVPASDEGAAIQWVAAEVRRRRSRASAPAGSSTSAWHFGGPSRLLAAATAAVLAIAVGYVAWDREPAVEVADVTGSYRAITLRAVAPVGAVRAAPRELEWSPVDEAVSYDVVVLEVDRTILWQGTSATTRASLPASVVAQFEPGKPILWEVTARDRARDAIAVSGTARFQIALGP